MLDYFWHITLPVIASTIGAFATMTLLTKNSFLDEIKKQYVMTARAKGLTEGRVLYGHVFRNAMLIVIAGFPAVFISVFFGGSLIIETIFSLDGLGRLAYESAIQRDYPVVFGTLYVFGLLGLVVGLLSDLTYVWVDPAHRLREPRDVMRLTAAAAPPPRQLQGQPPRLLVALDLPRALPRHALRRVRRQRPAARRPLPGRASASRSSASTPRPTSAASSRPEAEYSSPEVRCLIRTGGVEACLDDPEGIYEEAVATGTVDGQPIAQPGWMLWPPIPFSFNTINYDVVTAPSPPDRTHWLGTDDQTRDVVARVIYGFRISVLFALVVAVISSLIGIVAGACQGFFGGWVDLFFQRIVEIWVNMPSLYIIIILSAIFTMNFWLLTLLIAFFSLDQPRRRRPRRVPARPQLRVRPRRPRPRRSATPRSCSATCCRTPWSRP